MPGDRVTLLTPSIPPLELIASLLRNHHIFINGSAAQRYLFLTLDLYA